MSRLTRQQMKRDEVLETATRVFGFFTSHTQGLLVGFGVVVILALAVTAWILYLGHRRSVGNEMLAEAMKVAAAEVVPESADPDDPLDPTFASVEQRDARAEELFEAVVDEFGDSSVSRIAGVYLGRLAARRGDLEAARERWSAFLDSAPDHMLAAEVRLNLITLDRAAGRGEETVTQLREMLAVGAGAIPEVVVLDQLASALEDLDRIAEAHDVYQRIVDDHPASSYAARARQKLGSV